MLKQPGDIKRINHLPNNDLFPGQIIKVKAPATINNAPTKQTNTILGYIQYTVQTGDSLSSIALDYSSTVIKLKNFITIYQFFNVK